MVHLHAICLALQDNYFSGCAFVNNTYGIYAPAGNYYVTNTRFENSAVWDASITNHANSFRRVVSVGSKQFLNGGGRTTKLHQCFVYGFGSAAAPSAAVSGGSSAVQVYDTIFTHPANNRSVGVRLGGTAAVLVSNSTLQGSSSGPAAVDPTTALGPTRPYTTTVHELPDGDPSIAALLVLLSPDTHFLRTEVATASRVFDAVLDFRADNTGRLPASLALQACIDAAAAVGAGAVCHLRSGSYKLNRTLTACGAGYVIEGSGSGYLTLLQ